MSEPSARPEVQPLDPIWHAAFPLYYLGIAGYGALVALVPLQSLAQVNGKPYAVAWGLLLGFTALAACRASIYPLGGARGRRQTWAEAVLTAVVIALLLGYAWAVLVAAVEFGAKDRLAGAALPILLSVFPGVNVFAILRSGRLRPRAR